MGAQRAGVNGVSISPDVGTPFQDVVCGGGVPSLLQGEESGVQIWRSRFGLPFDSSE